MDRLRYFYQKLLAFLRIRTVVAGLDIADDIIRLAYFDGKSWQLHTSRLEPGVLENGHVKDKDKLVAALTQLKAEAKMGGRSKNKKISVVVSLSSVNAYTQVFNLPLMTGDTLAKAAELNLQMAAPEDIAKLYSGWEVVGKDEATSRLDVLSAFIDRDVVDELVQTLFTAGFLTMAVEPRSIAVTRILHEKGAGIDTKKPYLFLDVDNVGIDFLVIRNGLPYFEYSNLWKNIADASGEISVPKFEEELAASLRQVINFYNQHWTEPIGAVIIAAAALQESIEKTVATNATFPSVRLTLEMGQPISSEWLVGIGGALRGTERTKFGEGEISLLGPDWEARFQEERIFQFTRFWRVLIPVTFSILVILFLATDSFVAATKSTIESGSEFNANASQVSQITALEASSTEFNNLVSMAQAAENATSKTYLFMQALQSAAAPDEITIDHLTYPGSSGTISLTGSAPSEDRVVAFQTALENTANFSQVSLPPTTVQDNGGTYTFQMTFVYTP